MGITPVELRHLRFPRALLGYRRSSVEERLVEIAESFEQVWCERADRRDRLEALEAEMGRYRELESLLRATLVSAERAAHELKDTAKREADVIVAEAHAEARRLTYGATAEREHLRRESHRLRAQLAAALETLDDEPGAERRSEAA